MIVEVKDKKTGAILYKRSKESKVLDDLVRKVNSLEKKVAKLEKQLNK